MSAETIPCALDVCAAAFVEAMKVRRFSKATLASYQGSLAVFFGYLRNAGIDDAREVSRQTIADYQLWLAGKPYTDWTRVSRLQAVRRFFEHLEKTDVLLVNPCAGMLLPKIEKRLPRNVLTPEEAKALLNVPNTQTQIGIRDKAILEVFYSTGIRLEEMARLTVHDVDHRNGFVRVNKGKFAKDRVVPLGRKACDYVREYLDQVRLEWARAAAKSRPRAGRGRACLVAFVQKSPRAAQIANDRSDGQAIRPSRRPAKESHAARLAAHVRHAPGRQRRERGLCATVARPSLVAHHADLRARGRAGVEADAPPGASGPRPQSQGRAAAGCFAR